MNESVLIFGTEISRNARLIGSWVQFWSEELATKLSPENADNQLALYVSEIRVETIAPWLYHFTVKIRNQLEQKMDLEFYLCDALILSQDVAANTDNGKWELQGLKVKPATGQDLVDLGRPRLDELGMCHEDWMFQVLPKTVYEGTIGVVKSDDGWQCFVSCQAGVKAWVEKPFAHFAQFVNVAKEHLEIARVCSDLRKKLFDAKHYDAAFAI